MNLAEFFRQRVKLVVKIALFLFFVILLQVVLGYFIVLKTSLAKIESNLSKLTRRIEKDLRVDGNVWDTSLYNSDPLTPYPNGSSGFLNPLYIITKEGFIIERSSPIHGLLDTSDFKHLVQFQSPQTIDTVTNERWRVLSKPLEMEGKTYGVVVVSYYNPREIELSNIDMKMKDNLAFILSKVVLSDKKINTSKLDIRNIHYEFSFEIVDIYNNVLINNGRVPTFIDVSYFSKEMDNVGARMVKDRIRSEDFIVVSSVIYNNKNEPVGIIIAGESVQTIKKTLQEFSLLCLLISLLITIPLIFYIGMKLQSEIAFLFKPNKNNETLRVSNLFFDRKRSTINIDNKSFQIPYASNQYYICDALFKYPLKKWEHDQLLEKMGDANSEQINFKKVYDAVLAINKKSGFKLINYRNRTYFLNTDLLNAISKT